MFSDDIATDLFVQNDEFESESDLEQTGQFDEVCPSPKRQKVNDFFASLDDESTEESDGSDESDWEDIPIPSVSNGLNDETAAPESFNIVISNEDSDEAKKQRQRREKLQTLIKEKQKRVSIQYLSVLCYIIHARIRNGWISSRLCHKKLKGLLPESFMKSNYKSLKKLMKDPTNNTVNGESDKLLVYVIKYLIKWFRFNFKIDQNGLRVLGFLPSQGDPTTYFPTANTKIGSLHDFISVIKKFKHNRDTGAQVFTAILRSLGFEANLCMSLMLLPTLRSANLQPKLDKEKLSRNKDNDLLYPYFWTELINPFDRLEIFVVETICFHNEQDRLIRLKRFPSDQRKILSLNEHFTERYAPNLDRFNIMPPMSYVISFTNNNTVKDITPRYKSDISYRYFGRLDLRTESGRVALLVQSLVRSFNKHHNYTFEDYKEFDTLREIAFLNYSIPLTFSSMKKNPNIVTESTLRYNEVLDHNAKPIGSVSITKTKRLEPIYFKNAIIIGKSEQQWKFLGRSIKPDQIEFPIKMTDALQPRTIFKRKVFNSNMLNNQSELNRTKLYSFDQTCPYIKEKVSVSETGEVSLPRNKYGNIEIFKDLMIPDGCYWLKLSDSEKIFRYFKKNKSSPPFAEAMDYVPVVVGFDFRSKLGNAVPIKDGIIILKLQEIQAKKVWLHGKIMIHKLEVQFKELRLLTTWKFFLKSLRIKERVDKDYT